MKKLILLIIFLPLSVFSQTKFEKIIKLANSYSYSDELNAREKKEKYTVIENLEALVLNDSVNSYYKKEELREFSYLFLKKRAIGLAKFSPDENYLSNMGYGLAT